MKIIKFTKLFVIFLLLNSCKLNIDKNLEMNKYEDEVMDKVLPEKTQMEIRFSCGENGINKYIEEGWIIIQENTEEKICTWKSFPATKNCDMEKDKGCKITKPDKIGEERIYLLEKKL